MRVFGWTGLRGGVGHFRIREPLRGLRLRGHKTKVSPNLSKEIAAEYDVIVVRALHDHNSLLWEYLAQKRNHLLVYDLDDDLWNWNKNTDAFKYWTDYRLKQVEQNIRLASIVTTPSSQFAEYLRELNPNVHVVINTVPSYVRQLKQEHMNRFTFGWQGATQHIDDMVEVLPSLLAFLSTHSDSEFHLYGPSWIAGLEYYPLAVQDRVVFHHWETDIDSYYKSLNMHVGVAPLSNTDPFNYTKSGIKVQDYSTKGIVSIASFLPPYFDILRQGENGYFVDPDDPKGYWDYWLSYLYDRPELLERMSKRARYIARNWLTENYAQSLEYMYTEELKRIRGNA